MEGQTLKQISKFKIFKTFTCFRHYLVMSQKKMSGFTFVSDFKE